MDERSYILAIEIIQDDIDRALKKKKRHDKNNESVLSSYCYWELCGMRKTLNVIKCLCGEVKNGKIY